MVHCPRCGSELREGADVCRACGLRRTAGPHQARRSGRSWWVGAATSTVAVLVVAMVAIGSFWYARHDEPVARTSTPGSAEPGTPAPSPGATAPSPEGYDDFAGVYASVGDGVGEVEVERCDGSVSGSGFLVGPRRMVTSAHVVNGASEFEVQMEDGRIGASIEGVDKSIDLAVLILDRPSSGHVFDLSADPVRTGTRLAAIGFPLGEPKTLTEGTVSGSGREIETESGTFTDLLQTDTAINPGNSGGPLVDIDGEVVGIATAVRTDAQGIGYAVPSSTIEDPLTTVGALTPVNGIECGFDPEVPDAAVRTLYGYHRAINSGDYDLAMRALTPEFARDNFSDESAWHDGYETTYDDQLEVLDSSSDGDRVVVRMSFRSQQAPGYGPDGARSATCLRWDIDYELVAVGGGWLIDGAAGHAEPAWTRC